MSSDMTLDDLHWAIQGSFDWENGHLHQFTVEPKEYYSSLDSDLDSDADGGRTKDSREVTLSSLLDRKIKRILYEYDFGDSWEQLVEIKKVHRIERSLRYPQCVGGERHAPPENSGGIPGYEDFIEAMADPENPEHDEKAEWYGRNKRFNPERFGVQRANKRIHEFLGPYMWLPIEEVKPNSLRH